MEFFPQGMGDVAYFEEFIYERVRDSYVAFQESDPKWAAKDADADDEEVLACLFVLICDTNTLLLQV